MRTRIPVSLPGWTAVAVAVVAASALGVVVAMASGMASLTDSTGARRYHGIRTAAATPPATPAPSPTTGFAAVDAAGPLGAAPRFYAADPNHLLLVGATAAYATQDGGSTWNRLPQAPAGPAVADTGSAARLLSVGQEIWTSTTAGRSWQKVTTPLPVPGPYTALAINPGDPGVWFLGAQGRLLRTRDGGVSWRQGLAGLPPTLADPVIRPAAAKDSFLLASGAHVYLLKDNGQQVEDLGTVPDTTAITELGDMGGGAYAVRTVAGLVYARAGSTWSQFKAPLDGPLAVTGGRLLIADGGAHLRAPARLVTSTDGRDWRAGDGLPPDQSVEAVAVAGDGTPLAYCYGGDLFTSSDGGAKWRLASSGLRAPPA